METLKLVLMEYCQRILDENGMPVDWATSVAIPIFKGKGDMMNTEMRSGVKLLEHVMKIVECYNRKDWEKLKR